MWLVTVLPGLIIDVATFPLREALYWAFVVPAWNLYLLSRRMLVMEAYLMPRPEEVDRGLVTLGVSPGNPWPDLIGDLFDPTRFPVIDTGKGGSIHGVIDALNRLLELTIPPYPQPWLSERTFVIPGHGPVSDSHDLLEYRDMVVIVTDIIQDMINRGMTLEQVKAANPTRGYNARYGANTGPWTTEMFVTSVYKGLSAKGR